FLPVYENLVVNKLRDMNESLVIWKHLYEREHSRLQGFMAGLESVCAAVCSDTPVSHINGRVKSFDSLFNKIYNRANSRRQNAQLDPDSDISYSHAIKEPHKYYRTIFTKIKDLAGIRVTLLFQRDIEVIRDRFEELNDKGDIKIVSRKFFDQSERDERRETPEETKAR